MVNDSFASVNTEKDKKPKHQRPFAPPHCKPIYGNVNISIIFIRNIGSDLFLRLQMSYLTNIDSQVNKYHQINMNHKRQSLRQLGAYGLLLAAWPQAWGNGPTRVLVPFQPGGISSVLARTLATELNKLNEQTWAPEHIPGYSNMNAVRALLETGKQGQWDLMIAGPTVFTLSESMNPFTSIKADQDLTVLLGLIEGPMIVISHITSKLDHWQKIKQSKRRLRIGVSGLGSPAHFVAAHLDKSVFTMGDAFNTEGDLASMERLARNELDLAVISIGSLLPPRDSEFHVLLTSGSKPIVWRKHTVPTMASIGETPEAKAFHFYNWLSVCASAQMPLTMQQALTRAIHSIKTTGALAAVATATHHEVMHNDPNELILQISDSRARLEQYILRAELTNALGLELTR